MNKWSFGDGIVVFDSNTVHRHIALFINIEIHD